jgi:hypothetical protein
MQTAWYCDTCGQRYRLSFSRDGAVEIAPAKGRKITTIDVLKLSPQAKPVYFIVKGMRFEDDDTLEDDDRAGGKQFFYEEHSCPTNWLKPEMVYFDGDADPHGLIEFVETADSNAFPPDESYGPNDRDRAFVEMIERVAAVSPAPQEGE